MPLSELISSPIVGALVSFNPEIGGEDVFPVRHELVKFEAVGHITQDHGNLRILWSPHDPRNRSTYLDARKDLARRPVPPGTG